MGGSKYMVGWPAGRLEFSKKGATYKGTNEIFQTCFTTCPEHRRVKRHTSPKKNNTCAAVAPLHPDLLALCGWRCPGNVGPPSFGIPNWMPFAVGAVPARLDHLVLESQSKRFRKQRTVLDHGRTKVRGSIAYCTELVRPIR